jgi:hypothetical protein
MDRVCLVTQFVDAGFRQEMKGMEGTFDLSFESDFRIFGHVHVSLPCEALYLHADSAVSSKGAPSSQPSRCDLSTSSVSSDSRPQRREGD